jgi:hypothetical protein
MAGVFLMAIRLITGVIGAGKTYLAVHHIVDQYFTWSKETLEYIIKPEYKDLALITNIEGLLLPHISLEEAMTKSKKTAAQFFTKENQEKIHLKYPKIVYIIDEAQQYFHRRFYDTNTFFYFEFSRHFGDDIYLITQNRNKIARDIQDLIEYEMRATKRTFSVAGEMSYVYLSDGEIYDRKTIRPKKEIFELYKSMSAKETEKLKKPLLKYIVIPAMICAVAFFFLFKHLYRSKDNIPKTTSETSIISTAYANHHPGQIEKPKPKPKEQTEFLELQGFIEINGHIALIIHPLTNQLIPLDLFPYPVVITFPRTLMALVPIDYYNRVIAARNERDPREDSGGSGATFRSAPSLAGFPTFN